MKAKQFSVAVVIIGLVGGATSATATVTFAQLRIVSPPAFENVEGDGNVTNTGGPGRVQYLFPASDFTELPSSQRLLASFNLRGDATQSVPVDWTFPQYTVWISTTDKDSLTSVFDDNHGPDKTLVHDGAISFPILASGPAAGPRDIADGTRLQTPFYYDPSQGNLLVEVQALLSSVPFPGPHLDFQSTVELRGLLGAANSTSGTPFNVTPIAQFIFVPEPSTSVAAVVALFGLGFFRLRSHRSKFRGV